MDRGLGHGRVLHRTRIGAEVIYLLLSAFAWAIFFGIIGYAMGYNRGYAVAKFNYSREGFVRGYEQAEKHRKADADK